MNPPRPIIVRIIEPAKDPTGIAHVIVQAIGLAGAVALLAVLLGLVLAAVMIWVRSRSA